MGIATCQRSTINMFLRLLAIFSLFSISDIASAQNYYPRSEYSMLHPSSCDSSSCYPATGNLLIGREKNLVASSTCGLYRRERFCIMSHLTEKKKCFWCDSTPKYRHDPRISHTVDNVVYRIHPGTQTKSWWQAENGKENVTIQLNMEAEFQFTHMIITFKTFRPKAAIVERSYDFGLTWQVYRYFAYNCRETFPHVSAEPPRNLTDIVCESRYSGLAPSQDGEFIFRVLPQHFEINDPYSEEVQNLLKMTNLRINFTKLHTLGDDFLDQREEIQEKYYYAITDMIVRGSCSCYGHASQCLPAEGEQDIPDMIHGQCNCTHNTQGNNCEKCKDFYNDLPWKPAIGKATNACKRCNCHDHAFVCHFDEAVYENSGRVSGGVCEGCMHNTTGRNCELCRDFFYQEPGRDLSDPDICRPCDCDPRGSLDEGICDSRSDETNGLVAGRCHCKENVDGRRCDYCKNGFWNFSDTNPQGCEACTCNILGTVNNQGCDVYTGICTCKRAVEGRDCDQCMVEHWGLSEDQDGCKPCGCNLGGSLDNNCDIVTGQCRCLPHAAGRTCELPEQGYYVGLPDYLLYEAEYARISDDAKVVTREPPEPGYGVKTWTGPGFVRVYTNSELDFDVDRIYRSMDYDIHIRYEPQAQFPYGWEDVRVIIDRDGPVDEDGPCANAVFEDDLKNVSLPGNAYSVLVQPKVCLETGKKYNIKVIFKHYNRYDDKPTASILVDSIVLVPRINNIPIIPEEPSELWDPREFDANRCADIIYSTDKENLPEACKKYYYSIGFWTFGGAHACECDQTGSTSLICNTLAGQCSCKKNVGGRRCDTCVPGTYGFGPQGCRACDCNAIGSYDNTCERESGQCKCKPNTYGRMCDECQPGFWNFPNCVRCECNGHADICDSKTGRCLSCRDNTTGERCDECKEGYYGDPRLGVDIPCRACPCPGSQESGHSFANTCALDPESNNVVCDCAPEYAGRHCDVCADNYFGNPEVPGGSCQACECGNNIDITAPGNCDANTGECRKCLFNTEGFHCEICRDGFYGNATGQLCNECVCDFLGTNQKAGPCDKETGQCPCLPNVVGLTCDSCELNHWKIASGEGCEACGCDPIGSYKEQCNLYDGQCDCKPGFGGRQCDQCQANFWGDPNVECHECECYPEGAATSQCHQNNGSCVCLQGMGGYKCDQCARGYIGTVPHCSPCGECFSNWDRILSDLSQRTADVVKAASEINETGITGPYSHQYEIMAQHLDEVQKILDDTASSEKQIESLQNAIDGVRNDVSSTGTQLGDAEATSNKILQNVIQLNLTLNDLEKRLDKLRTDAEYLNKNATVLQESDIEGALTLTRELADKADNLWREADQAKAKAEASEKLCKRTEKSMENADESNKQTQDENARALENLGERLKKLEEELPNINDQVCDGRNLRDEYVNFCSPVCGGGGCGQCGGYSCEGAVNKAKTAVEYAQKLDEELKQKDASAEQLLREVIQVSDDTKKAHMEAGNALKEVQTVSNTSKRFLEEAETLVDKIKEFVNSTPATPDDIQKKASETLEIVIPINPDEIEDLAKKINDTIGSLTDIENILGETREDQELSKHLKEEALEAKARADDILKRAEDIVNALNNTTTAQDEAEVAIDKANKNTEEAGKDLAQITSETEDAYSKTNKTVSEVEAFQARLNKLNSALIKNQGEVKDLSDAADGVAAEGETVRRNVEELRREYDAAIAKVDLDYDQTGDTKRQADQLLQKASELSFNTKTKLEQLKDMEQLYQSHENELNNLTSQINELTDRMGEYLSYIIERSGYYQSCTS